MVEHVKILRRYASQNLEVLNRLEIYLLCNEVLIFSSDIQQDEDLSNGLRAFAAERNYEALIKASHVVGGLVVQKIASGYKIEVRRIANISDPGKISGSMGAGTDWQTEVIEGILHFCESCITNHATQVCSAAFIDDRGKYLIYDMRSTVS